MPGDRNGPGLASGAASENTDCQSLGQLPPREWFHDWTIDATLRAVLLRHSADQLDSTGVDGLVTSALRELAEALDAIADGYDLGLPG
jgi:hypothetical protein